MQPTSVFITLDEVQQQFQLWRANKSTDTRIPESLWHLVRQLLETSTYKRSVIGKALGISTLQLKKKFPMQFKSSQTTLTAQPTFIETPLNPLFIPSQETTKSTLTIERSNGMKLSMTTPTSEQLATLIKTFME